MKSRKKKTGIPGILIILILIFFLGLGWRYHTQIANYLGREQPLNTVNQSTNGRAFHYSSLCKTNPITNLADCQVIARRNLFVPLGGWTGEPVLAKSAPVPVVKQEPPKPMPDPIYNLILTGIVFNGSELLALVEDSSKNRSFYLKKGDKLKDYYVEEIKNKEMILANGDSKITQLLGSKTYYDKNGRLLATRPLNTVGAQIAMNETNSKSVPSPSVADSTPSNSSASSNNSNANLSLIEQMKARRKKELGQE